jgi:hypothetical protein
MLEHGLPRGAGVARLEEPARGRGCVILRHVGLVHCEVRDAPAHVAGADPAPVESLEQLGERLFVEDDGLGLLRAFRVGGVRGGGPEGKNDGGDERRQDRTETHGDLRPRGGPRGSNDEEASKQD